MSFKKSGANRGYDHTYSTGGFGYEAAREKWEDWVQRHYIGEFQLREGERILDIPCGDGFWSSVFAKKGFEVVGIDRNATGISEAKRRFPQIEFHLGNAEDKLPVAPGSFDVVFSRAITHFHEKQLFTDRTLAMLSNLMAYVRPGGLLLVSYFSKRDGGGTEVHAYHPLDVLIKVCETAGNVFKVTVVDNFVQIGVERRDARRPWLPLRARDLWDRRRHSGALTPGLRIWHAVRALQTRVLRRLRAARSGDT